MKPLKPWLSFSDQLKQLHERGLEVENRTAALDYLKRLGYYRLSGYWYPLRRIDEKASARENRPVRDDRFVPGMAHKDQETIAAIYGAPTDKAFAQWLRSLNFIRNVAAHHSRLWNINVVELSTIPEGWSKELKPSRPFFYFCLIQQLMRVICPNSSWGQRYKTLLTEAFPRLTSQQLSLKDMGVVEGWEDWPIWRGQ